MALIDIGSPAINRDSSTSSFTTNIEKLNPANASGRITSIEIWAKTSLSGCEVATFDKITGNTFSTRDAEAIGGVPSGSKQTFVVSLDVQVGDYIGFYASNGQIERTDSGDGEWTRNGDYVPCTNENFPFWSSKGAFSLYGTGITVPDQVTNVQATDGVHTDKVVITWNVASGATGYDVWNGSSWVDVGNVQTYDHTGAPAPTITAGTASASDGTSSDHVTLSIAGESANDGSSIDYKVRAYNAAGDGPESATNAGYRGVGALTYQWQRSAGDSDADYSNIDGATTDPYNDTGAPANGDGRYYKCVENATGATEQTTNADRGYRFPPFEYVGTGAFTYSGSGIYYYEAPDWEYIGSGNFVFSGTGICSLGFAYLGIGEFVYSGSAAQVYIICYSYEGSGVFTYSGKAVHRWGDWAKITKGTSNFAEVEKGTSNWTKVNKEIGDWKKTIKL